MDNIEKFNQLKKTIEEAQQKADRAAGALEQIMKTLKAEFGCANLEEAEMKLLSLQKQTTKAKKDFENALEDFEEKWEGKI